MSAEFAYILMVCAFLILAAYIILHPKQVMLPVIVGVCTVALIHQHINSKLNQIIDGDSNADSTKQFLIYKLKSIGVRKFKLKNGDVTIWFNKGYDKNNEELVRFILNRAGINGKEWNE